MCQDHRIIGKTGEQHPTGADLVLVPSALARPQRSRRLWASLTLPRLGETTGSSAGRLATSHSCAGRRRQRGLSRYLLPNKAKLMIPLNRLVRSSFPAGTSWYLWPGEGLYGGGLGGALQFDASDAEWR